MEPKEPIIKIEEDIKHVMVMMALATVVFFSVDKLGLIGNSYGERSLALWGIFGMFAWVGYMLMPETKTKE